MNTNEQKIIDDTMEEMERMHERSAWVEKMLAQANGTYEMSEEEAAVRRQAAEVARRVPTFGKPMPSFGNLGPLIPGGYTIPTRPYWKFN